MSFIMDVARSARVKFLDEQGHEQIDTDDPYLFLRLEAAGSAAAPQKRKAANKHVTQAEQDGQLLHTAHTDINVTISWIRVLMNGSSRL